MKFPPPGDPAWENIREAYKYFYEMIPDYDEWCRKNDELLFGTPESEEPANEPDTTTNDRN
jgi:hypothetical protein